MKTYVFAFLAVTVVSLAVANSSLAQPRPAVAPDTAAAVRGNTEFALDLYRRLAEKDGNIIFSPYSISTALAMTYGGARGDTAKEMADALRFSLPPERLHPAFADLSKEIERQEQPRFKLHVANRLWGQKNFAFAPDFVKLTEEKYRARLEEVDFAGAAEESRKTINRWVEDQTNKKITDALQPGILTKDTRLVLTNAIYLKAHWYRPFDPEKTKLAPFNRGAGDKDKLQVHTMHGSQRTRFLKADTFQGVELPYQNHELSMIVFLPRKIDGLGEFEKSLSADKLDAWLKKMSTYIVTLSMPKFNVKAEFHLNDRLKDMGMKEAFIPDKADFTGMTTRNKLHISHVLHKAFVVVNEKGTEAAASTIAIGEELSAPPSVDLNIDHPFFYLIRDNRTGSILFMGRVIDPS